MPWQACGIETYISVCIEMRVDMCVDICIDRLGHINAVSKEMHFSFAQ